MSEEIKMQLVPKIPDTKEDVSKEQECELYKQRYLSLKLVLENLQEQVNTYETRCRGADTVVLCLKECRQENIKLSKHVKAMETSISILQKRLEKHGLSNSVYTQDTEVFVPGASKQTLDNLAKENTRLRALLKQDNGHVGKKSSDEIEGIKIALEESESEVDQLKNKIKDMEMVKLECINGYENAIAKLTKEKQEGKNKYEQEFRKREQQQSDNKKDDKLLTGFDITQVQELRDLLNKTVEKCNMVSDKLSVNAPVEVVVSQKNTAVEKTNVPMISQDEYMKLEEKLQEAVKMNQQWQNFSKDREKQIILLNDRIQELSDPEQIAAIVEETSKQKVMQLSNELSKKMGEVGDLHKHIKSLSNELEDARSVHVRLQNESGTVEILKQQIQVCTEDFNNERKDREQAVHRAKLLQDEVDRLKLEKSKLKTECDKLKRVLLESQSKPPGYESLSRSNSTSSHQSSPPPAYSQLAPVRNHQLMPVQETPGGSIENLGISTSMQQQQQQQQQRMPFTDYLGAAPSPSSVNVPTNKTIYRAQVSNPDHTSLRHYGSLPRQAAVLIGGSPSNVSYSMQPGGPSNNQSISPSASSSSTLSSMPQLVSRGAHSNTHEELACPKCNVIIPGEYLLNHIESCTM